MHWFFLSFQLMHPECTELLFPIDQRLQTLET